MIGNLGYGRIAVIQDIERCSKSDYDYIVTHLEEFWDGSLGQYLHNPMLLNEFPDSAYVVKENGRIIAYMFALIGQGKPKSGYIHLVATHHDYRYHGLARQLYGYFENYARRMGCDQTKAITSKTNNSSVDFHRKVGMTATLVKNYAGPTDSQTDRDRWIFTKKL
jgi:GNAT superfamily N-acetyltransferase